MKRSLIIFFLIAISPYHASAATLINYDFNNQSFGVLSHESFWTMQPSGGVGNTPAVRLEYSTAGTAGKALGLDVASSQSNEFYVEFDVKVEGTPVGGSKFVKFFGDGAPTKNNMTLGLKYSSNTLYEVSYYGDSLRTVRYAGSYSGGSPTIHTSSSEIDIRGGTWGRYKAWVKRASPGAADGEFMAWWNGTLRLHVTGMESNPAEYLDPTPGFDLIEFGGYNNSIGTPWYLWIDNLIVSTTDTNSTPPTPSTAASPTIQWSQSSYTVNENIGQANFVITRTGDTTVSSSVNWGTYQVTALKDQDYVGVPWTTVSFAPGESSKTVSVTILKSDLAEEIEYFTLALTNPTNCTLGPITSANVQIVGTSPPVGLSIGLK